MRHQVLAERAFDEMERGLTSLLENEENQPFDRYGQDPNTSAWPFVVGHFQVDPDGRVQALFAPRANEAVQAEGDKLRRTIDAYWERERTGALAPSDARVEQRLAPE